MRFEKKLIILNGETKAKGTLSLERNAYGLFATLNVYNLPELKTGQYRIGLKTPDTVFMRELGAKGRILSRFEISNMDLTLLHAVIFNSENEDALLYGTANNKKLWIANRMDGFRSTKNNREILISSEHNPIYSDKENNKKDIRDYFFDIESPANTEVSVEIAQHDAKKLMREAVASAVEKPSAYNDTAVASINYYAGQSHQSTPHIVRAKEQEEVRDNRLEINKITPPIPYPNSTLPWEHQKAYIQRLKHETTPLPVREPSHAITEITPPSNVKFNNSQNNKSAKTPFFNPIRTQSYQEEAAFTIPPLSTYNATNSATKNIPPLIFYEQIKEQLDGLFLDNEHYTPLETLMPDTKWVRINFDQNKFYVVGIIGKFPEYICYGVPSEFSEVPPEELGPDARWMPENPDNPKGNGFWLMFQDATTGDVIA